jgi:hypothetical protein
MPSLLHNYRSAPTGAVLNPLLARSRPGPAPPLLADFSPQALLRQRDPHDEPSMHRQAHQLGAQHEWRVRDPHHDEPSGWRKHDRDPRGAVVEVPRSGVRDVPLLRPFQTSTDTVKDTTEDLRSAVAQHAVSDKVARLRPACRGGHQGQQEEAQATPLGDRDHGRRRRQHQRASKQLWRGARHGCRR